MSRAVIDQPGVRVLIIGLVLSIFIGLALRSQISETRVQVYINRSIDRLQSDFYVDYESAKVSLAHWGLPFPALVVQKIRLSPKSPLCQSSQIYAEELEVPISILSILGFSKTIPKIRIKEVELRLSDIERCIAQHSVDLKVQGIRSIAAEAAAGSESAEAGLKNIFLNKTKAELKEIYIEKLKIISSKKTDQPVLLKQLNVELLYAENRLAEVNIKARLSALKDARSDVYFLNSDFVAMFKAKGNNQIESVFNFNGKLLDGDVQLFVHNITGTNHISYELNLEHVSVKAIAPAFDSIKEVKNISFEKTPISISFKNNGKVLLNDKFSLESKFKNILINVENGLLKINELELNYINSQLIAKPFELIIENLSLSVLKNFDNLKNKLDSFESLGLLSGRLKYKNENSYKLDGRIENIQTVFSNRGRRDLQNVEQVEIKVIRSLTNLRFEASDFIVNNEKVAGNFWAQYNLNSLNITAQLKITGATLGKKIWEQFTFVEQSPKIEVLWNFKKLNQELHSIKIYIDKISLPGIKLMGLNIDINQVLSGNSGASSLNVMIKPAYLTSDPSFIENNIVSQVLNANNGFKLNAVNSNKTDLILFGSDWKNINFNLNSYFLSELAVKSDTHLSLMGSVGFPEGLKAKIVMQKRNTAYKFDLIKNLNDEIIIKRMQ